MGPCLSSSRNTKTQCTKHSFTTLCPECCEPPKNFVFKYQSPTSIVTTAKRTIAFNSDGDGPVLLMDIPEYAPTTIWARPRIIGCIISDEEVHCSPVRMLDSHDHRDKLVLNIPRYQVQVTNWKLEEGTNVQRNRCWGMVEFDGMKIKDVGTWFLGFDMEDEGGRLIQSAAWCDRFRVEVFMRRQRHEQELETRASNIGAPVWRRGK